MDSNLRRYKKLEFFMICGGIWQHFERFSFARRIQQFRLIFVIALTPLSVLSMFLSGFKESLSKYAFFANAGIFIAVEAYCCLVGFGSLKSIYENIREIIKSRTEDYQIKMFSERFDFLYKLGYFYLCNCLAFMLFYEIIPYFYDAYLAFYTDSEVAFMTPLPNEGYVGKNPKRSLYYYAVTIATTFWAISLTTTCVSFICMAIIFINFVGVELRIISVRILDWGNGGHDTREVVDIVQLIEEHQRSLKLVNELKVFFGPPLAVQNISGSLSLTLYAFTILVVRSHCLLAILNSTQQQMKTDRDMVLISVNAFCLVVMGALLYVLCFMGEKLQTESSAIFKSLCDIPWYEMPPKIRKELNMMLRQAKSPNIISFKGRSPLTLSTSMQILNSSYSYFMLLRSMIK